MRGFRPITSPRRYCVIRSKAGLTYEIVPSKSAMIIASPADSAAARRIWSDVSPGRQQRVDSGTSPSQRWEIKGGKSKAGRGFNNKPSSPAQFKQEHTEKMCPEFRTPQLIKSNSRGIKA